MIGDRTYKYDRRTLGSVRYKNLYNSSFGYTETHKKVSAASAAAVLAATAAATGTKTTVTSGITQPDVPRNLTVTPAGTTANILDSGLVATGINIEGKPISELFQVVAGSTTAIVGNKAFKRVDSFVLPGAQGSGVTFAVGTGAKLGVNHRLFRNNTTVKVYADTSSANTATLTLTLQGAPTVTVSEGELELNTVQPATTPDGSTFLTICYEYDNWALEPVNDEPEYSTSTSTSSTSSSTSTTTATTTSTSSTSSSTSSTSQSTSSTSSSTSSTSTSTTTAP